MLMQLEVDEVVLVYVACVSQTMILNLAGEASVCT
jgi:hypothetical protein